MFLESSRPNTKTGMERFIWDCMSKDAHNVILRIMTKINCEGYEFLEKLSYVPIVMIEVHCLEIKIAVNEWNLSSVSRVIPMIFHQIFRLNYQPYRPISIIYLSWFYLPIPALQIAI